MGVKVIIRAGTCGGMQEGIDIGKIVIATAACREDGVTDKMIPSGFPAVCDTEVIYALEEAARERQESYVKGIILTTALFYPSLMGSNVKLYAKAGVKALENEVAGLLVLAGIYGIKAGAILTADSMAFELIDAADYNPSLDTLKAAIGKKVEIALDAIIKVKL
jgi:uridine phosphorylase